MAIKKKVVKEKTQLDYLKSIDNTIYDKSTWDTIGKWDPIKLELII